MRINLSSKYVRLTLIAISFFAINACGNSQTENVKEQDSKTFVNIDVKQCADMIKKGDVVLLDVRTPEETGEGKIEGALELDFYADNFEEEVLKLDRDKTYIVYCRSGGRSSSASEIMVAAGFKSVHNLKGGYTEWSESNPDE